MIARRLAATAALLAVLSACGAPCVAWAREPPAVADFRGAPQGPARATASAAAAAATSNSRNASSSESGERAATAPAGAPMSPAPLQNQSQWEREREQPREPPRWEQPGRAQHQRVYTNQFVIQVEGGEAEARRVAEKHGFVYLNHILADYYHLEHRRLAKRSLASAQTGAEEEAISALALGEEPQVLLLERQELKRRVKRDFYLAHRFGQPASAHQPAAANQSAQASRQQVRPPQQQQHQQRPTSGAAYQYSRPANQAPNQARPPTAAASSAEGHFRVPAPQQQQHQAAAAPPSVSGTGNGGRGHHQSPVQGLAANRSWPSNDPSWPLMWYLDRGARNGFDLNVMAAWRMGFTGKGVVITILDDGLEHTHPDLKANYDQEASYDINGDDGDPTPRYDEADSNRHGTRCAGEVAAVRDNNLCSIGIAYDSKVGGVRMLDGEVTDAVEARSLGLNNQHIHIYSASWGPDDNGKTVDGPGLLATTAFIEGVTHGRQGLGSIFVFASGNGGREHDNCNCDGYTNSIWTLSISSATENGLVPWYIEACSSTLATTYSSGSYDERQISTTDIKGACTSTHTGTSASAPLAAGICALVLESNPRLTWRDMQHIVVRTSRPANLVAKDWRQNALGRNVSHAFGYGLMDAAAMIQMALRWTTVPTQYTCEVQSPSMDKPIAARSFIQLILSANCNNIRHLEHVQSKLTLTATRRGDLHIYLISPQGTRSTLLAQRPQDTAEQGFKNWPFMTVHSWGESPNGEWKLEVHNGGKPPNRAYFKEWSLIMYGTSEDPNRHLDAHRTLPVQSTPPAPIVVPTAPVRPAVGAPLPVVEHQPPTSSTSTSTTTSTSTSTTTTTSTTSTTTTEAPTPSAAPKQKEPKPDYDTVVPVVGPAVDSTGLRQGVEHNMIDAPLDSNSNQKSAHNTNTTTTTTTTTTPDPLSVDLNQIDSRLQSKDYRSSGDQMRAGPNDLGAGPGSTAATAASSAAAATTAWGPKGWPLLTSRGPLACGLELLVAALLLSSSFPQPPHYRLIH